MFWDFPDVKVVIGGTPKGMGVFSELVARGKDPNQPLYHTFHYTSFDSPFKHIHKAIHEDIAAMPELVVKQEIYAEFLEDSGTVFRGIKKIATATPEQPIPNHYYVMGVDLAKVQDYTVISIYDRKNNHQVYQNRFNKLDWNFQKSKIISIASHYNNALVMLDATGIGDPIADDLIRAGVAVEPYKFTNESKKQLIEKMSIWIEQRKCRIINLEETIQEFNNFTYDVTSSGRITYNAPVGFFDDIVVANCLAIWGLQPLIKEDKPAEPTLMQEWYSRQKGGYEYQDEYVEV